MIEIKKNSLCSRGGRVTICVDKKIKTTHILTTINHIKNLFVEIKVSFTKLLSWKYVIFLLSVSYLITQAIQMQSNGFSLRMVKM